MCVPPVKAVLAQVPGCELVMGMPAPLALPWLLGVVGTPLRRGSWFACQSPSGANPSISLGLTFLARDAITLFSLF